MRKVLIVDDDKNQLNHMEKMLSSDFRVNIVETAMLAWDHISSTNFDAVIVDAHMPIINGFEFIQRIQQDNVSSSPVVFMLSSDTSLPTKIQALKLGVSDFLWPQMSPEEIILRIHNRLNYLSDKENGLIHQFKNLKIDVANMCAYSNSKKLELTQIEFKMLSHLSAHPNTVVKRDELKEFVWPNTIVLDKTLNTHLTNLRNKLKDADVDIKSVKNEGIILS